jgi:hypothetical protein
VQPNAYAIRETGRVGVLTLELGCGVSVTRTESPPPAAAWRSSTAAEATGSCRRRLRNREVDRECEEADEEGDHEDARGEEKPFGRPDWWAEAVQAATAAVASSIAAAARSGVERRLWCGVKMVGEAGLGFCKEIIRE